MIKNWKIDDVLDPDSNFWSTVHDEITIYLEAIGDSEPRAFYTFSKKIQEYLNSFKKQPSFSLDMFGIDMQEPRHTPDEINQADALISTIIWDLVSEEDKHNLFDDSVEYFNEFIDSCPNSLLDDFVRKLANGENLIPESRRKPKNIKEIIFNTFDRCYIGFYCTNFSFKFILYIRLKSI